MGRVQNRHKPVRANTFWGWGYLIQTILHIAVVGSYSFKELIEIVERSDRQADERLEKAGNER